MKYTYICDVYFTNNDLTHRPGVLRILQKLFSIDDENKDGYEGDNGVKVFMDTKGSVRFEVYSLGLKTKEIKRKRC